jgi:formylglycine-generating enzyme required for sulfatase activity
MRSLWLVFLLACDTPPQVETPVDGAVADGPLNDKGMEPTPDMSVDAERPGVDAARDAETLLDASRSDAALPDAALADTALPDAALPDAALPDAALPDAALPDAALPDVCAPMPERCNGRDDDCDGRTDEDFRRLGEACMGGVGACAAAGRVVCNADGRAEVCDALPGPGAPDTCNGIDDDCDGRTDEAIAAEACYIGPPGTVGVGACRGGLAQCVNGERGACEGQVLPAAVEACANGLDDDCDGVPENGCACNLGDQQPCGSDVGRCERGIQRCAGPEGFGPCEGEVRPAAETCDGTDEDCDGRTDEGLLNACGACGPVPAEACNRADDDCDGATDEGVLNACGACGAVPQELCNALDDDCDGELDEAFPRLGEDCVVGVGACRRQGTYVCDGLDQDACSVRPGPAEAELCNGQDDDCDGRSDEGDLRQVCYDGPAGSEDTGVCQVGFQACEGGRFGACQDQIVPTDEACDGDDTDCDGEVDEGDLSVACYEGPPGTENVAACRGGRAACVDGAHGACEGQVLPGAETCEGSDQDCDGQVDEAFPEQNQACSAGVGACRRDGRVVCRDATPACGAVADMPAEETCNAADDDCDGATDEGDLSTACYGGPPGSEDLGLCHAGEQVCANGALGACEGQQLPVAEVCNGEDDDCDNETDEGLEGTCCQAGDGAPPCNGCGGGILVPDGFVCIPPGEFTMGGPVGLAGVLLHPDSVETPHRVQITRPFLIQATEVTRSEWAATARGAGWAVPDPAAGANCCETPVERVSWYDAVRWLNERSNQEGLSPCYRIDGCMGTAGTGCAVNACDGGFTCEVVEPLDDCTGYRLPTEAQWEHAARAGSNGPTPGEGPWNVADRCAMLLNPIAWSACNAQNMTHPVGTLQPNAWGVYDALGNVWEWVQDSYAADYGGLFPQPVVDPIGPPPSAGRVHKGGAFTSAAGYLRIGVRAPNTRDSVARVRSSDLGFRVIRSIEPPRECPPEGPTLELCDGLDNDCNGVVDDTPLPPAERVTFGGENAANGVHLVPDGDGFAMTWYRADGGIRFARADAQGVLTVAPVTVQMGAEAWPVIGWSGSTHVIAGVHRIDPIIHDLTSARVDGLGRVIGASQRIGPDPRQRVRETALAYAHDGSFGFAHAENFADAQILYYRLNADGTRRVGPQEVEQLVGANSVGEPSLAYGADRFYVAWRSGSPAESVIRFTWMQGPAPNVFRTVSVNRPAAHPSLAWNGQELGLSWHEGTPPEVFFQRLSSNGDLIGGPLRVSPPGSSSLDSSVVWTGEGWAVTYYDEQAGEPAAVLATLDAEGARIRSERRIPGAHALVWNGTQFGVAYLNAARDVYLLTGRLTACDGRCGGTTCPDHPLGWPSTCSAAQHCEYTDPQGLKGADIYVPPGEFSMGAPLGEDGGQNLERPVHGVRLQQGFFINKYEVSVAEHLACEQAGVCGAPSTADRPDVHGTNRAGRENHPQNGLDYQAARTFCAWTGGRLPSEAEWEYAATGPVHRPHPWGKAPPDCTRAVMDEQNVGNNSSWGCGTQGTSVRGMRPAGASFVGAHDMIGNVAEWVEDVWHDSFDGAPTDGAPWGGPEGGTGSVRGGTYYSSNIINLRTSYRPSFFRHLRYASVGVRCARDELLAP